MRRRRHDPNGLTPKLGSDFGANHAKFCPSRNDLRQQSFWQSQKIDHLKVPSAGSRIHHLCGSCVRVLADGLASKKEIDQVRNQQQLPHDHGNSFLCMGVDLKQRIECQKLNAGALENLFARNVREDLLHHSLRSFVPVGNWKFEEFAFSVNQSIINAPAIDSDALNWPSELARSFACSTQANLYFIENPWKVPAKVPGGLAGWIVKSAYFFKQKLSRRKSCKEHAPATRTEVDGDVKRILHYVLQCFQPLSGGM